MSLAIVTYLLEDFHSSGINYCHWKSNEHVEAALNGDTDLDLLFDEGQKSKVIAILKKNKFHLFEAVWYRKYKGIVDYIGFDEDTGKIIHVHTHFFLDLGETGIKNYRLPWGKMVLNNRVLHPRFKVYTSSPEVEFLLLIVRTAFKYNARKPKANRKNARDFNTESDWLCKRLNEEGLISLADKSLTDKMTALVRRIKEHQTYDETLLSALKKLLIPYFANHRILSSGRVRYLKWVHLATKVQRKTAQVFHISFHPSKRHLPQRGIVVSLMGSDGSGKSTQTKELTKELAKKVDVLYMYMGSGDGPKSFHRNIIHAAIRMASKLKNRKSKKGKIENGGAKPEKSPSGGSFPKQLFLSMLALSLALEKKKRLKRIAKARQKGTIVVCDRYPQTTILGYNDGPKLSSNLESPHFLLKRMAQYEFSCYAYAQIVYPDLVVKLTGSVKELYRRRPEMSEKEINKKQKGILNTHFDLPTKEVMIDIENTIPHIKGMILNEIADSIPDDNAQKEIVTA